MKILKSGQVKIVFCERSYRNLLQMGYDPARNVCFVPMMFFVGGYPLNTPNALISPHTFLNHLKLLVNTNIFNATRQQFQSHPKILLREGEFVFSYDENMTNTIQIISVKYENQIRFVWKFLGNKRGVRPKRTSRKIGSFILDAQELACVFDRFSNYLHSFEQKHKNTKMEKIPKEFTMPTYKD